MKKYSISLLISLLLFHFMGCYSYNNIEFSELKNLYKDKNIRITTKKNKFFVVDEKMKYESIENKNKSNPDCIYCIEWQSEEEKLTLKCYNTENTAGENFAAAKMDSTIFYFLNSSEIGRVEVEKFSWGIIAGLVIFVGIILLGSMPSPSLGGR